MHGVRGLVVGVQPLLEQVRPGELGVEQERGKRRVVALRLTRHLRRGGGEALVVEHDGARPVHDPEAREASPPAQVDVVAVEEERLGVEAAGRVEHLGRDERAGARRPARLPRSRVVGLLVLEGQVAGLDDADPAVGRAEALEQLEQQARARDGVRVEQDHGGRAGAPGEQALLAGAVAEVLSEVLVVDGGRPRAGEAPAEPLELLRPERRARRAVAERQLHPHLWTGPGEQRRGLAEPSEEGREGPFAGRVLAGGVQDRLYPEQDRRRALAQGPCCRRSSRRARPVSPALLRRAAAALLGREAAGLGGDGLRRLAREGVAGEPHPAQPLDEQVSLECREGNELGRVAEEGGALEVVVVVGVPSPSPLRGAEASPALEKDLPLSVRLGADRVVAGEELVGEGPPPLGDELVAAGEGHRDSLGSRFPGLLLEEVAGRVAELAPGERCGEVVAWREAVVGRDEVDDRVVDAVEPPVPDRMEALAQRRAGPGRLSDLVGVVVHDPVRSRAMGDLLDALEQTLELEVRGGPLGREALQGERAGPEALLHELVGAVGRPVVDDLDPQPLAEETVEQALDDVGLVVGGHDGKDVELRGDRREGGPVPAVEHGERDPRPGPGAGRPPASSAVARHRLPFELDRQAGLRPCGLDPFRVPRAEDEGDGRLLGPGRELVVLGPGEHDASRRAGRSLGEQAPEVAREGADKGARVALGPGLVLARHERPMYGGTTVPVVRRSGPPARRLGSGAQATSVRPGAYDPASSPPDGGRRVALRPLRRPERAGARGPVVQLGVHAGLSSRRSRVQIPSGPPAALVRSRPRSAQEASGARAFPWRG